MIVSEIGKTYSKSNIKYLPENNTKNRLNSPAFTSLTISFNCFQDLFKISPNKFANNFITAKNHEEFVFNITKGFPEAKFLIDKNKTFKKRLGFIKDVLKNREADTHKILSKALSEPEVLMGVIFILMGNAAIESYHYTNLLKKSNVYTPAQIDGIINDNSKILDAVLENWDNMLPSFTNLRNRTQKDIKSILKTDFRVEKAEAMEINTFDIDSYKNLSDNAKSILLSTYFIQGFDKPRITQTAEVLSTSRELDSDKIINSLIISVLKEIGCAEDSHISLAYISRMFGADKADLIKTAFANLPKETADTLDNAFNKGLKIKNEKELLTGLYSEIHKQQKNKQKSMQLTLTVLGKIYECIKEKPATKEGYRVSPVLIRDAKQPVKWFERNSFYQDHDGVIYPKYFGDRIPALIVTTAFKTPWEPSSIKTIEGFLDEKSNNIYLPQIFEPKYRYGFDEDEIHLSKEEFLQSVQYLSDEYKAKLLMSDYASKYEDNKYEIAKKMIPELYEKAII